MTVLKALFSSKKFLAASAAIVVVLVSTLTGVQIPEDLLLGVLGVIASYVVGQGIADNGKEAARISSAAVEGVIAAAAAKASPADPPPASGQD